MRSLYDSKMGYLEPKANSSNYLLIFSVEN